MPMTTLSYRSFLNRSFKPFEKEGSKVERSVSCEKRRRDTPVKNEDDSYDDDISMASSSRREKKRVKHKTHRSREGWSRRHHGDEEHKKMKNAAKRKDGVKKKKNKKTKHSPGSPSVISSSSSSPSFLSSTSSSSSPESADSKTDRGSDEVTNLEKKKQKLLQLLKSMEDDDAGKTFDLYKEEKVKEANEMKNKQKKVSKSEKVKVKRTSSKEVVSTLPPVDFRYSPASDVSSNDFIPEGDDKKSKAGSQESIKNDAQKEKQKEEVKVTLEAGKNAKEVSKIAEEALEAVHKQVEPRSVQKKEREVMCLPLPRFAFDLPALRKKPLHTPQQYPAPKTPPTSAKRSDTASFSPLCSPPIVTPNIHRSISEVSNHDEQQKTDEKTAKDATNDVVKNRDMPHNACETEKVATSSIEQQTTTSTESITATTTTSIPFATTTTTTTTSETTTTTPTVTTKHDSTDSSLNEESNEDISNSLEERIRLLDEKLSKIQQGVSKLPPFTTLNSDHTTTSTPILSRDYREKYKRHRRDPSSTTSSLTTLETPFRPEPSDLAKIFLSRSSIFDQDTKRLEMLNRIPCHNDITTNAITTTTTSPPFLRSPLYTRSTSLITTLSSDKPPTLFDTSINRSIQSPFTPKTPTTPCAAGDPRRAARDHSSLLTSPTSFNSSFKWGEETNHVTAVTNPVVSVQTPSMHRGWPATPLLSPKTPKDLTSPPVSILKKHKEEKASLLPTPPATSEHLVATAVTNPSTNATKRKADTDLEKHSVKFPRIENEHETKVNEARNKSSNKTIPANTITTSTHKTPNHNHKAKQDSKKNLSHSVSKKTPNQSQNATQNANKTKSFLSSLSSPNEVKKESDVISIDTAEKHKSDDMKKRDFSSELVKSELNDENKKNKSFNSENFKSNDYKPKKDGSFREEDKPKNIKTSSSLSSTQSTVKISKTHNKTEVATKVRKMSIEEHEKKKLQKEKKNIPNHVTNKPKPLAANATTTLKKQKPLQQHEHKKQPKQQQKITSPPNCKGGQQKNKDNKREVKALLQELGGVNDVGYVSMYDMVKRRSNPALPNKTNNKKPSKVGVGVPMFLFLSMVFCFSYNFGPN